MLRNGVKNLIFQIDTVYVTGKISNSLIKSNRKSHIKMEVGHQESKIGFQTPKVVNYRSTISPRYLIPYKKKVLKNSKNWKKNEIVIIYCIIIFSINLLKNKFYKKSFL